MVNINDTGRITYSIVGRYMNGSAVSAYHIIGNDGKEIKASRELVCYLVGKGLITNCKGQMNGGDVVLRGIGVSLTDLPVKNERTGEITRTDKLGQVRPKTDDKSYIFSQLMISGRLFQDGKCVGYVVKDAGGTEKKLERGVVIKLASDKKIGNARINMDNGKQILRGVGVELDKLPVVNLPSSDKGVSNTQNNKSDGIKMLKINWYEVENTIVRLESKMIMDKSNNASGIYKYPVIDLMRSNSATMRVNTDRGLFKVTQVRTGINNVDSESGIEFILNSNRSRLRVQCDDMSVIVFNIHVLGYAIITALMKVDSGISVREFTFENKLDNLLWREYAKDNGQDKHSNTNIEIRPTDMKIIRDIYDIELSPLSNIGVKRRYPTMSMVACKEAIMGINTSNGYHELNRVKYGIDNGAGIAMEIINKSNNNRFTVVVKELGRESATTKNVSVLCCAALTKQHRDIEIKDVVVENEFEQSVVGYYFNKK